jgi:hypothetical protein
VGVSGGGSDRTVGDIETKKFINIKTEKLKCMPKYETQSKRKCVKRCGF